MSTFNQEGNELKWNGVYTMGNWEYDKITVTTSPKDILSHLMKIPRPVDDEIVSLEPDTWYNIQFAIKLIMDAYGIHLNQDKGLIMHDESNGNSVKELDMLDKSYWWLDKFKTKWNPETKQAETL